LAPHIVNYQYFYLFIILGLICGFIAMLFLKFDDFSMELINKKILKKIPRWFLMIFVGLLVGVSGYFFKDIFGVGYSGINNVLDSSISWQVVLILLALKFFLVPITLNSGGFGGTFAPALFMGACTGYLFSLLVNYLFGISTDPTTFTLVGMGAMLGGINSIPITAILMIFEMTQEYSFILPLMLSVIVSSTIVQIVNKGSYYLKRLEKQGFRMFGSKESGILRTIYAEQVMQLNPVIIHQNAVLKTVVAKLMESKYHRIYLVDDNNNLSGVISDRHIRELIEEFESLKESIIANDIADNNVASITRKQDLDYALKLVTKGDIEELPVIESDKDRKIVGVISRSDILSIYNKETLKSDLADGLTRELSTLNESRVSRIADGYSIIEKKPRMDFIGKTLSELKLRNNFGLEVLMIKKTKELFDETHPRVRIVMPSYNYVVESDDILILFGTDENIGKTSEW
ncbi:MAG TPA: chloride channel protein, partial [Ignavibacteriaceae bacterium]|nr:chloride channel protein [Ignavibacteriaceae bacterium]